jgi:hypothetical protein
MTGAPKTSNDRYECGNCGHEVKGYTKTELEDEGWAWHRLNGGMTVKFFVLCDTCQARFEPIWEAKAA